MTAVGLLKHVGTAMSVYLIVVAVEADVTRTRTIADSSFSRTGFEMGAPVPSTKVMVADGLVVVPMRTGGLSLCAPAVPAVFVKVCISQSAALPLWLACGVVAVTSIRAQSTSLTASPVPETSWTSTVLLTWLITGVLQVPEEYAVAATLMFV